MHAAAAPLPATARLPRRAWPPSTLARPGPAGPAHASATARLVRDGRRHPLTAGGRHRRPHPAGAAVGDDAGATPPPPSPPTPARLWLAAAKPAMYTVALVPVAVGGAAAVSAAASAAAASSPSAAAAALPWAALRAAGSTLAAAAAGGCAVIAWLNLSNDAWDAATGVDASKAESVVNLLGGRVGAVHAAAAAALAAGVAWLGGALEGAGCAGLAAAAAGGAAAGDPRPAALLAAAVAAGYVYQGPPFRASYAGLGEPLCFSAFGPLATTAFYLVGARALAAAAAAAGRAGSARAVLAAAPPALVTPTTAVVAALVGATTTSVLFCSHFHQFAGDRAAGKRSPIVRLGGDTAAAAALLARGVGAVYAVLVLSAAAGWLPLPAALAGGALSAAPARALLARAAADHAVPARARTLKLAALDWHAGLGAGLTLGLAGPAVLASARAAGILV